MMAEASREGLGWTMNIPALVATDMQAGRLVPLSAQAWIDVPIYWQHWQVRSQLMAALTDCVLAASREFADALQSGGAR